MKQRTKNMQRPKWTIALLPALLLNVHPVHAQDVAALSRPMQPFDTTTRTPISDGGMDWLSLAPAEQLLITFRSSEASELHLEVLNEQGVLVLTRRSASRPGRTLLPLNVDGLASGRYVLRVQQGGATSTSRFLRP